MASIITRSELMGKTHTTLPFRSRGVVPLDVEIGEAALLALSR
jgi:hypothetical protein